MRREPMCMRRFLFVLAFLAVLPIRAQAVGEPPRVAVLDSGLYERWESHPEFSSIHLVAWHDFQDGSPTPIDPVGHGTAVASLAVGATLGQAPDADLIVGRVLDASNSTTWPVVVAGIDWAVQQGADVINVSIWSPSLQLLNNRAVGAAIERARTAGALVVWIAGNDYAFPDYPATALVGSSSPQALIVGSASADGSPSSWSRPDSEVLAAGADVTAAERSLVQPYGGGWNGTSFAAPRIAGAVARLLADGAPRDPDWLEWVVLHAASDRDAYSYVDEGYGLFDVAALERARAVVRGEQSLPQPDTRDVWHIATTLPRAVFTTSVPTGILP